MVETMIAQMSSQTEDESKHKEWCDAEITKSKSAQDEKSARLQRLATKIDNERETVNQLDSDLALEGTNSQSLQKALEELAKIRMDERDLHTKAGQNHAMAQQILSQATAILQRVNALAQQAQQPQTYGGLQAGRLHGGGGVPVVPADPVHDAHGRLRQGGNPGEPRPRLFRSRVANPPGNPGTLPQLQNLRPAAGDVGARSGHGGRDCPQDPGPVRRRVRKPPAVLVRRDPPALRRAEQTPRAELADPQAGEERHQRGQRRGDPRAAADARARN